MKKCVKRLVDGKEEIQNVNVMQAESMVKDGWKYCPKHEWKEKVRDIGKKAVKSEKVETGEKKDNRGKKRYNNRHTKKEEVTVKQ
jgi:uncharacterized Zn finger protein (UPF0148 family)